MTMEKSLRRDVSAQVRMTSAERDALDNWRRRQPQIPTRPDAIREAIHRLAAELELSQAEE